MITKDVVLVKLERLEAEVKKVGFHIRRNESDTAFSKIEDLLERIGDIKTLLNRESQN